jgi:hypothetical protein
MNDTIKKYGKTDIDKIYNNVQNYKDMITIGTAFVNGEMSSSYNHACILDKESDLIKESLLKLHEIGIFTINSQPNEYSKMYEIEYGPDKGIFADISQREYLQFILKDDDSQEFLNMIGKNKDFFYEIVNLRTGQRYSDWGNEDHVVTRSKLLNCKSPKWNYDTWITKSNPECYLENMKMYENMYNITKNNCCGISILSKYFDDKSPIDYILKNFKK